MNSQIAKQFEWIEHEGKRYANQKQFAQLLGIRTDHVKRWLKQRKVTVPNLGTIDKGREILYPYELVCTVILTLETKSALGMMLKKSLLSQLTQTRELPKTEAKLLAPPKATRDQLRETVNDIADHIDIPHNEVWRKLWKELYYRCHVNVKLQAKNQEKRPIDIIDGLDLCSVSISILKEVYA